MALTKHGFKDQNWFPFGGELKNGWEKERIRGIGREEEEKRRGKPSQKGMETNLDYGFYEIWYGSLVLYDYYLAQT